ncbi:MAG TPA: SDR family oxidoreductase [Terriglobia bacterium]|nr:SDR family oxidoreductase [Terriglobia bacterium]
MATTHFITGGTGFVGSNLILELLSDPGTDVYALTRAAGQSAEARLQSALRHAARAAGHDDALDGAIAGRCHAVEGDVHKESCGVSAAAFAKPDQFWHVAASLRYEDRYAAEIFRTNVEGTRNALALAHSSGVERHFNYVSTAYVSGSRMGVIREEISSGGAPNNPYEASKMEAEALVHQNHDLRPRIFRPSIVIGHSITREVSSGFSGLYGFIKRVLRLRQLLDRIQDGLSSRAGLRVIADPAALLNLIPVDVVARQMVRISRSRSRATIFHITNPTPPPAAEVSRVIFRELDLQSPVFVSDATGMNWIEQKIEEGLDFYKSYFRGTRLFDRQNTDWALGVRVPEPGYHMDSATITKYVRWYADVLRGTTNLLPATIAAAA